MIMMASVARLVGKRSHSAEQWQSRGFYLFVALGRKPVNHSLMTSLMMSSVDWPHQLMLPLDVV